jgi:hypothetical protein
MEDIIVLLVLLIGIIGIGLLGFWLGRRSKDTKAPKQLAKISGKHRVTVEHFRQGDRVAYIPSHAEGDMNSPDIERGVVSSTNATFVFVKFDNAVTEMITGLEPYTSQSCRPENLVHLGD